MKFFLGTRETTTTKRISADNKKKNANGAPERKEKRPLRNSLQPHHEEFLNLICDFLSCV